MEFIRAENGLPWWLCGKEPPCQCRRQKRVGLIPRWGRSPGGGNGNSLQYPRLEKFHGQRNGGLQSMDCKELDMTECTRAHTHAHTCII